MQQGKPIETFAEPQPVFAKNIAKIVQGESKTKRKGNGFLFFVVQSNVLSFKIIRELQKFCCLLWRIPNKERIRARSRVFGFQTYTFFKGTYIFFKPYTKRA